MSNIFLLLAIYQLKHFFADYPLQTAFMLGKFKERGWVCPLACHCLVHAIMTFIISVSFGSLGLAAVLALFDFTVHFVMDRIKASPKLLGRFEAISKSEFKGLSESYAMVKGVGSNFNSNAIKEQAKYERERIEKRFKSNQYFWYSLGLDQSVHHLTHYAIIYFLIK